MSKKLIILLIVPIIVVGLVGAAHVDARVQVTTTSTTTDLEVQIAALLAQIQELQQQILNLQAQTQELNQEIRELKLQLRQGMRGEEVTTLQETLATDPEIYPEGLVTGYFGPLTKKAVTRFQKKYGIDQVGEVGPQTRRAFNAFYMGGNVGKSEKAPIKLLKKFHAGPNAVITDTDNDDDDTGLGAGTTKVTICHKGKNTLIIAAPALNAHLKHGDVLGACGSSGDDDDGDDDDDVDDDDTDTTAPVITLVGSSTVNLLVGSSYTDAGATATDNVDGDITSSIVTVNPVNTGSADTYTITYNVSDAAGNPATEVARTVIVSAEQDTTAPTISNIQASVSSTTATIAWDTDEEADMDRVWYGTTTPLPIESATARALSLDNAYTFSHSVVLDSLSASTTYYFIVVSADQSGNTATSSENSLTTQ